MNRLQPLLAVKDVSVNFGGIAALANVSFEVHEGGVLSVIGPNGAGKTTLLNVISGTLAPSAGEVIFKERPIQGRASHDINRLGLARTFQGAEIFGQLSVRENVMVGGVASTRLGFFVGFGSGKAGRVAHDLQRTADEVLDFVGLSGLAQKSAANLPAGQQRLLGIARALATNPRLVLLDEPGAGLSDTEKLALVDVIECLSGRGVKVVLVEHDMNVVGQLSERIIVLDQGRLIAAGEPRSVKRDPRVIEAYLGTSAAAKRDITQLAPARHERLLSVRNLNVHYGGVVALDDVSIDVNRGEIVAILGANGAGKSTLLKSVAGLTQAEGEIVFDGAGIARRTADVIVRRGLSLTPEGRELFPSLSVEDNLILGRYASLQSRWLTSVFYRFSRERQQMDERLERVHSIFPILKERRGQLAGTLSGGQAQMLAIARSLMNEPALLMLDEPSLGLAPQIIDDILATLVRLRSQGLTILLVEQNARAALQIADRAYVLANGAIATAGSAQELLHDREITSAYLGQDQAEVPEPVVRMSAGDFGSQA